MKGLLKAAVLGTAVIVLGWGLVGCSEEPGADYLETDVTDLMRGLPGEKYKLSTPDIAWTSGDFGIVMDGETMMVVEGDGIEDILTPLIGTDFWLLGRKAGKPYIHFRADGVLVGEEITPITNVGARKFPLYRPGAFDELDDYTEVNLSEIDYQKKKMIDDVMFQEQTLIQGVLEPFEVAGLKRYAVRHGETKVVLEPVTENLAIFLELLEKNGGRFVAAGMLNSIKDWDDGTEMDREATHILGDYKVGYLLYGNVAVPNM
jgi:hypothetical protein